MIGRRVPETLTLNDITRIDLNKKLVLLLNVYRVMEVRFSDSDHNGILCDTICDMDRIGVSCELEDAHVYLCNLMRPGAMYAYLGDVTSLFLNSLIRKDYGQVE